MNRTRLLKLLPYAAAIGVFTASLALAALVFERQVLELWSWAIGFAEANWRRAVFGAGGQILLFTTGLLILELFLLSREKTTIFRVFVRHSKSSLTDLAFTIVYFTRFKLLAEYVFTFGWAYLAAKLVDDATAHIGWWRLDLPTEGVLGVTAGFAVFYLISSFIGYWHHRFFHTTWLWKLHRFHHAATDLNILTGFRDNPAASLLNVPLALQSLLILKVPDAGLFAAYFLANQIIATLQHSELPWDFGWFGRWVVTSPRIHQIHHSIDEEHRHKNFSNCPMWDHLFGTWYGGSKLPSGYGIPEQDHVERPLTQWLIDVWVFYSGSLLWLVRLMRSGIARIPREQPISQAADTPASIIPAE